MLTCSGQASGSLILYLAQKDLFAAADWTDWFESRWPADDPLRDNADSCEVGLAKRRDLRAFSQAVYISAEAGNEAMYDPLGRAAFALLNALP